MKKFLINEDGHGYIEYVLILSLIAIVLIVAFTAVGITTQKRYEYEYTQLRNA